jgi:hypothetical protein
MKVADFGERILALEVQCPGDVVVAGPGGLYDVVAVRELRGDIVLEIDQRPVPVTRRPRKRKRAAA